ncbi:BAR-domain-containing protein [Trametes versicolor FP-101664 SS1]|uniref:BAR-domain-containing protein n=1 Tax=Trametes versicolor (strain FP-101664) TaxID=717944 RepID=UPI0004623DCF|nr:BAR-domain-containing protein [Trametes versicolor FP-101664 SS1]EIW65276.1 BAR-domain-containing protein [Trametes versicolor FP-101664 SS1]
MKGIQKAFARTPHMLSSKVGMSKKSNDPEFDDYSRRFESIEKATEKLLKDSKAYTEAVTNLFTNGADFATHFSTIFHPLGSEYALESKHPDAEHTIGNVDGYVAAIEELKASVVPELELIDSRIVGPIKEFQGILKTIRKSITKREHKLVDYDRFNTSLTKLRDKKEKTLNDEKNLFKLEQDFEIASTEYDYINTAMKTELPRFLVQATQFIDPLFHSFYYMQLNIFYLMLEKLNGFAEGKFEVSVPAAQIASDYEAQRSDALERIEALNISKRLISTARMVQSQRQGSGLGPPSSLGRSTSTSTTGSRSPSSSSFTKKAPPPPPSSSAAPPPPYSPPAPSAGISLAGKKAPPPPPPLKPKPKPAVQYVVALYDFEAQADGDLEFKAGDRIEVVERTDSVEDWWTGRLGGRTGVFPGNYVQDT